MRNRDVPFRERLIEEIEIKAHKYGHAPSTVCRHINRGGSLYDNLKNPEHSVREDTVREARLMLAQYEGEQLPKTSTPASKAVAKQILDRRGR